MSSGQPIALVTGASGDIGGAIAKTLGIRGWHVIGTYVGAADAAAATAEAISSAGGSAEAMQLDQRDPEAIDALIETVRQKHNRLDVLVNNAAWNIGIPFRRLDELTADIWDRVMETNLRAPFLLARAAATLLSAGNGGHIVNISSAGGISPGSSSIAYSSSKAGLNSFNPVSGSGHVTPGGRKLHCSRFGGKTLAWLSDCLTTSQKAPGKRLFLDASDRLKTLPIRSWPLSIRPLSPAKLSSSTVVCPARCANSAWLSLTKG